MDLLKSENGLSKAALAVVLLLGTVCIAFMTVFMPYFNGLLMFGAILGLMAVVLIIHRFQIGIVLLFLLSVFMFYIQRTAQTDFPFGIVYDFLAVMMLVAMLLRRKDTQDWSNFLNPITLAFLGLILYNVVQVLNPMGTTLAWAVSFRRYIVFILYIIFMQVVLQKNGLRRLMHIWLGFALVVALYGIFQHFFGLSDAERSWIYSSPERVGVYVVWGKMRNFSFLSDPSAYGIFCAYSALTCLVLAIRSPKGKPRMIYAALAVVILIAMSFSGTRTAYAMIAAGMGFYILLTLRTTRTIVASIGVLAIGLVIFFGPFHGWQINRIRSAFSPSEDASMGVRDEKRLQNQPFVRSHPFGGGVYTTAFFGLSYAPGHPFAGFDPDSGYLETAMESGWVGLIFLLAFMFLAVSYGVDNYFKLRNPGVKTQMLAHLVPVFAMSVAHYAQNAMFAKPIDLLVMISLAVISQACLLERKQASKEIQLSQ